MSDQNTCLFTGRLGADPEISSLNNGKKVANFRLAVGEQWRDKNSGEKQERTEWVPVVCFNEGICGVIERFLKKGSLVRIAGKFQTRSWEDQEGKKRFMTEIVLQNYGAELQMLGGRNSDDQQQRSDDSGQGYGAAKDGEKPAYQQSMADDMNDTIPF